MSLMPGEFAPHDRTLIAWPCRDQAYPGALMARARSAHAELARAIARYEPVTMIAPTGQAEAAAEACGGGVEVVELPVDDSWVRDSGPIYVFDGPRRTAVDFAFNGWGEKFLPYDADAALVARWTEHAGHERRAAAMVLEGGSISSDGAGTLLTTQQCLLHPNRNPAMSRTQIEAALQAELGASVVVWLPWGLALDADTDGHVDNVACFAAPGRVVVQGCDDTDEEDHVRLSVNRRWLEGSLDAQGRPIDVVEVPVLPFVEHAGERLVVPYLNYYVGNGFVVVPVCGHDADDDMLAIIAEQYPGRDTFGLDVGEILAIGGGGIHCVTQQVPATVH